MSVTTTQNPATYTLLQTLTEYDLHHSGSPEEPNVAPAPNTRQPITTSNPDWWPTEHNRIPPYRPVNRHLDREERPDGVNPIERTFIFVMLNGCGINATAANLWRNTGGRLNGRIFYYKIGGEK